MQCLYIQRNLVLLSGKGIYLGGINCIDFTLLWRGIICIDNSENLITVIINSTDLNRCMAQLLLFSNTALPAPSMEEKSSCWWEKKIRKKGITEFLPQMQSSICLLVSSPKYLCIQKPRRKPAATICLESHCPY